MSVNCPEQFANRILTDLGVCENKRIEIIDKLTVSIDTYNNNKSKTSLSIIAADLYDCLRPTADDIARITADELSKTFIYILIITAIFIVLIVIVLVLLDGTVYYGWTILISIVFSFLYVGLVFLLASVARTTISNNITNSQNSAVSCVDKAITELTNYENDQQKAISDALCAYSDTEVTC
jgi:hypothetical protein